MDLAPDTEAGFHSVDWIFFKLSVFRAQFALKGINSPRLQATEAVPGSEEEENQGKKHKTAAGGSSL